MTATISALIFDFDGLILDTETPDYLSWREVYAQHGVALPLAVWQQNIGSVDLFNPYAYLEDQLGRPLDWERLKAARRQRDNELLAEQSIRPGIEAYLAQARALGLKVGIASSSRQAWVNDHLARLGLAGRFDVIRCRDDVGDRAKPDPAVYRAALDALAVAPPEALALEDSPNGAAAALAAGVRCVVVPNDMTAPLTFPAVDYVLDSLATMSLPHLLAQLEHRDGNGPLAA